MFAEGSFGVLSWDIFVPKQGMRADGYRSESNIVKNKKNIAIIANMFQYCILVISPFLRQEQN